MFESIILGAVQGIAEWLPVSSEAMIILVKNNFFPSGMSFSEMISYAIFLHFGTLLAVMVYYRKKVFSLVRSLLKYRHAQYQEKNEIHFIIIATFVSGVLGFILLKFTEKFNHIFENEILINFLVAGFLCITAILLFISEKNKKEGDAEKEISEKQALFTGIFQAFAAIPGISRSGSTIAGMGILGISKSRALELSFLLSIPLVLFANIILNYKEFFNFSLEKGIALASAFIFGIATIHLLLKVVEKIRFSFFVGSFALLLIILNIILI